MRPSEVFDKNDRSALVLQSHLGRNGVLVFLSTGAALAPDRGREVDRRIQIHVSNAELLDLILQFSMSMSVGRCLMSPHKLVTRLTPATNSRKSSNS